MPAESGCSGPPTAGFEAFSPEIDAWISGRKRFQGDERTPEGRYTIDYHNPRSAYHLSLHISYPNPADRAYADESHQLKVLREAGVPCHRLVVEVTEGVQILHAQQDDPGVAPAW